MLALRKLQENTHLCQRMQTPLGLRWYWKAMLAVVMRSAGLTSPKGCFCRPVTMVRSNLLDFRAWLTNYFLTSPIPVGTICLYRISTENIKGGDKHTAVVESPYKKFESAHQGKVSLHALTNEWVAPLTHSCFLGVINDAQWHTVHPNLFGSVGDDSAIKIWNYSTSCTDPVIHLKNQHQNMEVNCIQFSMFNQYVFVTGTLILIPKVQWDYRRQSLTTKISILDPNLTDLA